MSTTFRNLEDFAARAPKLGVYAVKRLLDATRRELHQELAKDIRAIIPVGSPTTKDRRPGRLKRSLSATPGRPIEIGGGDAPHATIIDRGRKRGVTPRGQKRIRPRKIVGVRAKARKEAPMLGSKQAPQGITRPAWRMAKAKQDRITAKAIATAERDE